MSLRKVFLIAGLVWLAPIVISVVDRHWNSLWVVPAGLLPLFLFAEKWPTQWSFLSLTLFGIAVTVTWTVVRRSTPQDRWRGIWRLALLALAGPVMLIGGSALLGASGGIWAPPWFGAAAVAWSLLLLFLTRGVAADRMIVWLVRAWIAFTGVIGLFGFVYGILVALCC